MINRQNIRMALDLEIRGFLDPQEIEYYLGYQKALDQFCRGELSPKLLIEHLGGDNLINIDDYLLTIGENLKWL
jgi:hypothetical protein